MESEQEYLERALKVISGLLMGKTVYAGSQVFINLTGHGIGPKDFLQKKALLQHFSKDWDDVKIDLTVEGEPDNLEIVRRTLVLTTPDHLFEEK